MSTLASSDARTGTSQLEDRFCCGTPGLSGNAVVRSFRALGLRGGASVPAALMARARRGKRPDKSCGTARLQDWTMRHGFSLGRRIFRWAVAYGALPRIKGSRADAMRRVAAL